VIFEVLTAVKTLMIFFRAEDKDSMFLRNADIYLQVHMASQPRRTTSMTPRRRQQQQNNNNNDTIGKVPFVEYHLLFAESKHFFVKNFNFEVM
jgi:hypothetical protein